MRLPWLAACLIPLVVAQAEADESRPAEFPRGEETCYGRAYDAAHLKAHPKQTVTRFFLWNELTPDPLREYEDETAEEKRAADLSPESSLELRLFLQRRDRGPETQTFVCGGDVENFYCGVECDGGTFSAKFHGEALTLTNEGFMLEGVCEGGTSYLEPTREDTVFRLDRLTRADCLAERDRQRPSLVEAGQPLRASLSDAGDVCYERTYDAAHLAAAKNQTVAAIWLRKSGEDFFVGVRQRDGKAAEAGADCFASTYAWACFNPDGKDTEMIRANGTFGVPSPVVSLSRNGEGTIRLANHRNNLARLLGLKLGAADDVFRLSKAEPGRCAAR